MGQAETDGISRPVTFWSRKTRTEFSVYYIYAVAAAALVLLCGLVYAQLNVPVYHPPGSFAWASFVVLLMLAVFAEMYSIRIAPGMEVSAGFLACFVSAAIVGPLGGFVIAVISQLPGVRQRLWQQTLFYCAALGLVTGVTSFAYWAALSLVGGSAGPSAALLAVFGLGAGFIYQALNFAVVVPVIWLRRGIGARQAWHDGFKPFLPFALFFLAISLGLISIYYMYMPGPAQGGAASPYSTLLVILCLLPVVGLIYAFRAYAQQRQLADHNAKLAARNERLALQAVSSQVAALDLKDNYTARHSAAVAQWACDIAAAMELSEHDRNLVHLAGLLHDIGKIGIPDDVLKSPAKLDRVNWSLIESHCYNGYKILKSIDQFQELATVVLHHHEHYNGNGYPRGLKGDQIPLASRIICVADSYSAMVSNRPYGPALPPDIAMAELEFKKGTQFDPDVVECFLAILDVLDESYRRGEEADFNMEVQQVKFLKDLPQVDDEVGPPVESGPRLGLRPHLAHHIRVSRVRERMAQAHEELSPADNYRAGVHTPSA